jgi:ABC-type nitrate/sulfonate/bicarbonate transport system substrate-binding protein
MLLLAIIVKTAPAAQPPTKVIMTTGSFSEREAAMYVAQDHGFFRRYGLDLTFVHVRSGPVGMAALAAGETQLHEGSVTGAVLGSAAEGTDLVFVAGMINKLIGNIMASPKIKNPADLKGKVIGVTSPSGGSWMFTTLALEYWGLDAKRDGISFRVLGDEAVRSQALLNDTIAATHLGYTFAAPLKTRGFTNLAQLPIPFQSTGVMTRRSFINSSPEVVEASCAASSTLWPSLLNRKTRPRFSKVWPRDFVWRRWNKPWKATRACPCYMTSAFIRAWTASAT